MQTETRASLAFTLPDMTSVLTRKLGVTIPQTRKLPDRILVAVHQACDLGDLDVAAQLLSTLETVIGQKVNRIDPERRRTMESMVAAHNRLWQLRHDDYAAIEPIGPPSHRGEGYSLEASRSEASLAG